MRSHLPFDVLHLGCEQHKRRHQCKTHHIIHNEAGSDHDPLMQRRLALQLPPFSCVFVLLDAPGKSGKKMAIFGYEGKKRIFTNFKIEKYLRVV